MQFSLEASQLHEELNVASHLSPEFPGGGRIAGAGVIRYTGASAVRADRERDADVTEKYAPGEYSASVLLHGATELMVTKNKTQRIHGSRVWVWFQI